MSRWHFLVLVGNSKAAIHLEPHRSRLRSRDPQALWQERLIEVFDSQVRGPAFEQQARTFVERFASEDTVPGERAHVGPSRLVAGGDDWQLDASNAPRVGLVVVHHFMPKRARSSAVRSVGLTPVGEVDEGSGPSPVRQYPRTPDDRRHQGRGDVRDGGTGPRMDGRGLGRAVARGPVRDGGGVRAALAQRARRLRGQPGSVSVQPHAIRRSARWRAAARGGHTGGHRGSGGTGECRRVDG